MALDERYFIAHQVEMMTACVSDIIPRMSSTDTKRPTIAHFKGHGVTRLIVYCTDLVCNHRAPIAFDSLADDLSLSDLQPRLRCKECGRPGEPRPDWPTRPQK
jgi:hypothetical protein